MFLPCQLRRSRNNDSLIAISTPNTQILVSNITVQKKEAGFLRKITNSRVKERNIQNDPGAFYSISW